MDHGALALERSLGTSAPEWRVPRAGSDDVPHIGDVFSL